MTIMKNLAFRKRQSLRQSREAAENCQVSLPDCRPSARDFHLLGLLHDGAGDPFQAGEFYRKALYLEPDHCDALIYLALLEDKSGRRAAAKLLKGRTRRGGGVSTGQKARNGR
jgi:chemotaxis protein methyltransferase WspC